MISTNPTRSPSDLPAVLALRASNVTGTQDAPFEVDRSLAAGRVADGIARAMSLPDDVAWALRDDRSSAFLDDAVAIGDQLAPGARVTVTPKTHLGGRR